MGRFSLKELIEAGVHFGHRQSRWNPKMGRFIYGKRNAIHIIDLRQTVKGLVRGARFLKQVASRGEQVLFVGTKRQARTTIASEAQRAEMPYVSHRWLGGTLTNFQVIHSRLARLKELEEMESSGELEALSKKEAASLRRERMKILNNMEGIREMNRLPGALFIIDPRREIIAVREAAKIEIPVVAFIDTDSDPDLITIPIPGNDDAMRAIQVVCGIIADAVVHGCTGKRPKKRAPKKTEEAPSEEKAEEEKAEPEETVAAKE